ncbi:hypothetical protein BDQ17DRAFT_1375231, partial [Cyathus striatus]
MARIPFLCISIYLLLHFDILFLLRPAPLRMYRLLICVIKYFQLFHVDKYMGILNRIVLGRWLYLPNKRCSFTAGVS